MFKIINKCVRELHHGENIYNGPDISEKELNEFFESVHDEDRINVTSQFQKSKTSNQPFDIVFKIITYNNCSTFTKKGYQYLTAFFLWIKI